MSTSAPSVRQAYVAVTAAAGLGDFLHAGFLGNGTASPVFPEMMGAGACWIDADGDGRLDLFLTNGRYHTEPAKEAARAPTSRLYRNLGGGAFADATAAAGAGLRGWAEGCAVADYDNDGDADLFVGGYGMDVLLRNDGGVFTNATAALGLGGADCSPYPCWSSSATWFDADRDGCMDLYVSTFGNYTIGGGMSNDPDHAPEQRDRFYRGGCGAPFTDATDAAGFHTWGNTWSAVAYDVNGDGWSDLYVSNDQDKNELWINDGDGTFTLSPRAADPRAGMGTAIGDLDGNGLPDLVTTNFMSEDNGIFLQQADGTFNDIGGTAPFTQARWVSGWAVFMHDVDHDGRNDLTVVNSMPEETLIVKTAQPVHVFRQRPTGGFEQWNTTLGAPTSRDYFGRGAAWADMDDDGDLDMVLAQSGENPTNLWRMDRPLGHSLTIDLVGTAPGVTRDAEGARVTVSTTETPTLTKEKRAQQGFLSSNDPRVHFGLGGAREANVTIRWPDGSTQAFSGVPANSFVRVVQGGSLEVLKRLPIASATGPQSIQRLASADLTATLDVPAVRAVWDLEDGDWAVCEDGVCRNAAGEIVGTLSGGTATLSHTFRQVGAYDVRVALTDAQGREAAARITGDVTARLLGSLSFEKERYAVDERPRGIVQVGYEGGEPLAGANVRLSVEYSFWPFVEDLALPLIPAGVRTVAGYRTLTVDGVTDAHGTWAFELPLWWQSPLPAASAARFNPVGDYDATLSGGHRGVTFTNVSAGYQVTP